MNLNNSNNIDQCQHPEGCVKSLFTYCPHCHLFLCIIHLNQHHDLMKNDIHQTITEAENYRSIIEQQIHKIKQQQITLNNFYENEIKNLNHIQEFLRNICENNSLFISDYEQYMKQYQFIKENQLNNSFLKFFTEQIDQIIQQQQQQQQNQLNDFESKDEISLISEQDTTLCTKEELIIESTMECDSNETISDNFTLQSKSLTDFVYPKCPLSHINAFGFSLEHNIPDIPCKYTKKSKNLTFDQCYYHLICSHRLKPKAARLILKTLSSNSNPDIDVTTLNLFSNWKSNDILSQGTTLFVGQCPLTQKNIYGLQNQHHVILCTPRPPVHLYQHLRTFHRFKSTYARRLINALIEKIPITEIIFKQDERIFINSKRLKN